MRRTRSSKPPTIWRPNRLRTINPVTSSRNSDGSTPQPRMSKPKSSSGCQARGSSTSDWSRMPVRKRSTQIVTTIGIQISSPAIR